MSEAPERIALRWAEGAAVTSGPLMQHPEYTNYVRADRIDELQVERNEALNQLDSALYSVSVLEKRAKTFCDGWKIADKGRIEAEAKLAKAVEALQWLKVEIRGHGFSDEGRMLTMCISTLAELTGGKDG